MFVSIGIHIELITTGWALIRVLYMCSLSIVNKPTCTRLGFIPISLAFSSKVAQV